MIEIFRITGESIPTRLQNIPKPPKELTFCGVLPNESTKLLTIVGSRNHSNYGNQAVKKILSELVGHDICIVSGLALGIDTLAHEYAIEFGLQTVAFPGSGLAPAHIYPASNKKLSERIILSGGALISEFPPETSAAQWTFPTRNRLMAGIADCVLVVEATADSGTLITAGLALEYGTCVAVIPGNIFSEFSSGSNELLKQGAVPITGGNDILRELNLESSSPMPKNSALLETATENELSIYKILSNPLSRGDIAQQQKKEIHEINVILSMMELRGLITEHAGLISRNSSI